MRQRGRGLDKAMETSTVFIKAREGEKMKKYRIAFLCTCLLLCSCKGSNIQMSETAAPSESSITTSDITTETGSADISETGSPTVTSAENSHISSNLEESDTIETQDDFSDIQIENVEPAKESWLDFLDPESAAIQKVNGETAWRFWTDSCLMRYSNGVYYTETDHDQFFSESKNQKNDFSAPIQIFVGDEFNGLKVTAAQFVVLGTKNFNFASISFSGCAVLKGVLFIRNEDDPYMGINKQGDVWFFPYPESIEQYPLCFAPQDYFSACFDESSFHIFADTPQLYLGNAEDGKLDTRINEIQLSTWSVDDVDWTLNSNLREMLQSDNYQFICYEAELEISEIKLLYYEDFMTGSPRSSANISRVVNLSPLNDTASTPK